MSSFCAGSKFWFSSICAEVIAIVYNIPQVNPLDPEAFECHCSYAWYVLIDDWCHFLTHRLRKLKIIFRLQSAQQLPSFRKQILYCTDQYSASYVWHQTHKSKYDTRCALWSRKKITDQKNCIPQKKEKKCKYFCNQRVMVLHGNSL